MERSNPRKAALWMMGAVVSFTAMAVAGRESQAEMNTFELMLYRSLIGLVIVLLLVGRSERGFSQLRTGRLPLHLQRNLFHYTGQNLWFFAVATIPLSQLVALEFTNPIWVALLAPFLLGERLTRSRLLAALIGFVGVLVVAQPGAAPLEPGHVAALVAAVFFALNTIYTRQIMHIDSVLCVLFWMTLLQGAASVVLSAPGGIPVPSPEVALWLVVVGVTGLTAHYALTSALGHAPASIVAPMEFLRLPLIALVGMWVYGEALRPAVFLGAALIVGGNLVNLLGESRRTAT
jgi:drug/metabolite transporter (DMT)-like permease